jgi:undecaprenyl-diphosphatase
MEQEPTRGVTLRDRFFHPRRVRHGWRVLGAIALVVATALPIESRDVPSWERAIFEAINGLPGLFYPAIAAVMQLGNLVAVPVVALLAFLVTRRWRVAVDLALSGVVAWLFARLLKDLIHRGRPATLLRDVIVRGQPAEGFGYVSGHAAVAAALATVISVYFGPKVTAAAITLAALVGLGRIYVGAHLPLDVIGGWAVGWAVGSLVHFLVLPGVAGKGGDG